MTPSEDRNLNWQLKSVALMTTSDKHVLPGAYRSQWTAEHMWNGNNTVTVVSLEMSLFLQDLLENEMVNLKAIV